MVWVDKNKINDLKMHEGDYNFFKWFDECEGIFTAKFNYVNGALKDYVLTAY